MNAWWDGLSDRERVFVGAGGAIAALFIGIQLIANPLLNWREEAIQKADGAKGDFLLVQEAAVQAGGRTAIVAAPKAGTALRAAVSEAANKSKLTISYISAANDGRIEVSTSPASTEQFYDWLQGLETEYGVVVMSADIARSPNGVGVTGNMVFGRPGA